MCVSYNSKFYHHSSFDASLISRMKRERMVIK
jgi:hypothetical protein